MGIILNDELKTTSDLTKRINADLRERAQQNSAGGTGGKNLKNQKDPDLVEDSDYARDLKKTGRFSWIWIVLIILALIALVVIVLI